MSLEKCIISYEQGYSNWYVSEFYKYFHANLEKKLNTQLRYEPLSELARRFDCKLDNHSDSLFNWFNLVIYNQTTNKFFIHSWYDYANATIEWCVKKQFDIAKFSAVSNITEDLISKYSFVQPSVYYLENWSDHDKISEYKNHKKHIDKIYFAGLAHGIRHNILTALKQYKIFDITTKSEKVKQKTEYYSELSQYKYGLSLNGAANICYRDIELFGLGVLNLRNKLNCLTFDKLLPNVHYINFVTDEIVQDILLSKNIDKVINDKIDMVIQAYDVDQYMDMLLCSKTWYQNNCLPKNQFNIILEFVIQSNILE